MFVHGTTLIPILLFIFSPNEYKKMDEKASIINCASEIYVLCLGPDLTSKREKAISKIALRQMPNIELTFSLRLGSSIAEKSFWKNIMT